ncbi:MAG: hypothetical protein ACXWV4_10960 [Flavitalea sp.]
MKKMLTTEFASKLIISILSFMIVFHILVMLKIIPTDMVWGGNIETNRQFYIMEMTSVILNLFFIFIVSVYAGFLKLSLNPVMLRMVIWTMFILFLLNSIGNLMSKNPLEAYLFTPLTILLAFFCFRIAAFGFETKTDS